ncbi:hypothetical protein Pedsa_1036 [Pseudopedobacter saltans DSM 12145]|uniref:Outer membrane efflux protein n=1 Tax=Pseudopedobacter saltans (strain ATCC 51119 / DSM 12145 / JCM 21818 / CCUG 39354 / LMG 10337 / NBRC 100064 / NCIMB 13643) TaxID=762903 RepID=F0SBG1_PSESL|nr:TolC family protein [Pseudopedobacter saltans]ADY51607.1 hypothetical protein Pedsa_1036 [Pseudopedobacter saltans DSM 12145]
MKRAFSGIMFLYLLTSISTSLKAQDNILGDFSYLYMEKLIAVAKENYPKNKVFESRINVANNNLSIAKASWFDPLSFNYVNRTNIYNIDGVNSSILSGYFLNVNFSPASILVKKPFQVKNARSEIVAATAERDEYALQLETEVKTRYTIYVQNLQTLKLVSQRVVDAESTFTNMKAKYERSEISFREFNDVSTYLTSVKESKVAAEANLLTSKFQLEELLTVKLEDIK